MGRQTPPREVAPGRGDCSGVRRGVLGPSTRRSPPRGLDPAGHGPSESSPRGKGFAGGRGLGMNKPRVIRLHTQTPDLREHVGTPRVLVSPFRPSAPWGGARGQEEVSLPDARPLRPQPGAPGPPVGGLSAAPLRGAGLPAGCGHPPQLVPRDDPERLHASQAKRLSRLRSVGKLAWSVAGGARGLAGPSRTRVGRPPPPSPLPVPSVARPQPVPSSSSSAFSRGKCFSFPRSPISLVPSGTAVTASAWGACARARGTELCVSSRSRVAPGFAVRPRAASLFLCQA